LKRLEKKGKLVWARLRAFRLFGLIGVPGNDEPNVSSPNPAFTSAPLRHEEALMHWRELRQAEALMHWQRWIDQPK